jgi:O-antigen ligase
MSSWEFRTKYAWPASIRTFRERPVMGYGLGNNLWAMTHVGKLPMTSHNDYLVILIETGIIGLTFYLTFLFSMLLTTYRAVKSATDSEGAILCVAALAVLLAFMTGAFGEHLVETPGATGYVFSIVAMAHGVVRPILRDDP